MKHLKHLLKYKFLIIIFVFAFTNLASAQTVSTTDQAFTGANFGTTIEVPINTLDINSNYGNIVVATIRVEYDENILTYTGYTNMNATIAAQDVTVYPAGVDGVVQFNIEADDFWNGFEWPDGLAWDIQFTYNGGYSIIDITIAEFVDLAFATQYPGITNGSVTGFEDIYADDGDWHTTSIWTGNMGSLTAPGPGHKVSINPGGTVTISADAICNDLTIGASSNGQLTLNSGNTLEVLGDFLIESVATGTGSFIQNGTLSVTGTTGAERYIAGTDWLVNLDGWHFLSSPVASQAISGAFTPSGPDGNYDFYRWYEPTYTWQNQKVPAHGITTFVIGKGYLVAYEQAGTKTFSGIFNTTDKTWDNLTRTNTLSNMGWNLIGNPYPCAIEWGNWSLNNISTLAKVWGEASAAYIDINLAGIVPAMNGLMVQVTNVGVGSLTIPAADRTHNTTPWYKSENQRILLVARDLDYGELAQQSVIRFNDAATEGYDSEFDCYFLEGYAPVFNSVAEGKYLSTNTLPEWSTELIVPFMFEKNGSSNFMIELAESIEGYDVFLKDLKENIIVNLTEITNYAFASEEGDDPERFEILFGVVGIENIDALAAAYVYSYNNKIIIANVTGATNMDIFNIQGQSVYNLSFNSTGFEEIAVDLPSGIYMIRLSNSGEIKTSKVFIK